MSEVLIEQAKRAFEGFAQGDSGPMAGDLADDIEWIVPGNSAISGTKRGKDEVFAHWQRFAEQLRGLEMKHYLSDGEHVAVAYDLTFDGGSCPGVDVLTYRDGKIVTFQAHADTALMERVYGSA
jgi:uncharacterized protein